MTVNGTRRVKTGVCNVTCTYCGSSTAARLLVDIDREAESTRGKGRLDRHARIRQDEWLRSFGVGGRYVALF